MIAEYERKSAFDDLLLISFLYFIPALLLPISPLLTNTLTVISIFAIYGEQKKLNKLGFKKEKVGNQFAWGILFSLLFLLIALAYEMVLGQKISGIGLVYSIPYLIFQLVVAFAEELYFRAFLFDVLEKIGIAKLLRVLISALLFSFIHFIVYGRWFQAFFALLWGGIISVARLNICDFTTISCVFAHFIYNVTYQNLVFI